MDHNPTRGDSSWVPHQQLQDCGSTIRTRCNQHNRRKTHCWHNRRGAQPKQSAKFATRDELRQALSYAYWHATFRAGFVYRNRINDMAVR